MKKTHIPSLILVALLLPLGTVYANNGGSTPNTAPTVSIGEGNNNAPANTGPVHGAVVQGNIDVYATVSDTNLENYHFRVVKDGGPQGHTCTSLGGLFAPENQGYASTTQSKDACGFNFNQSAYTAPTGFINTLIATLNTEDLIAFGGEGDYWLIIGGVDIYGGRTDADYLNDPKVKITIATPTASSPGGNSSGNGGGGTSTDNNQNSTGGSSRNQFTRSQGIVLGAYTGGGLDESCGLYMDKFIRSGRVNDSEQVKKLQAFLNKRVAAGLVVTGVYDEATASALSLFQSLYANEILAPWGLTSPTGIVYQTTLRWINILECPGLSLPVPVLIEWSKNPNVPALAQVFILPTLSPELISDSETGQDGETPEKEETSSGFWDSIKGFFSR